MPRLCPLKTKPTQSGSGQDEPGASASQRLELGRHARLKRLDARHDDVIAARSDNCRAAGAQFRDRAINGDLVGATLRR